MPAPPRISLLPTDTTTTASAHELGRVEIYADGADNNAVKAMTDSGPVNLALDTRLRLPQSPFPLTDDDLGKVAMPNGNGEAVVYQWQETPAQRAQTGAIEITSWEPSTQATLTLVHTTVGNLADGDVLQLNGLQSGSQRVYLRDSPTLPLDEVEIGATLADTLDNLAAHIATPGTAFYDYLHLDSLAEGPAGTLTLVATLKTTVWGQFGNSVALLLSDQATGESIAYASGGEDGDYIVIDYGFSELGIKAGHDVPADTDYEAAAAAIASWVNANAADFEAEASPGEPSFVVRYATDGAAGNNKGVVYSLIDPDEEDRYYWTRGGLDAGNYPFAPALGPIVAIDENWVYIDAQAVTRCLAAAGGVVAGLVLPASDGSGRVQNIVAELQANPYISGALDNKFPLALVGLSTWGGAEGDLIWVQRGFLYEIS